MVLHRLEQRFDRLAAKVVLAAGGKGVRLVDEQHAAERRLDDLLRFERRLPDVARDEPRAIHLDKLPLAQCADGGVQPRHEPRHGRFAGAGVAEEHHMQAHGAVRQAVFLAQLAHFDEIREIFDLALDRAETDKFLKLCHQLFKARLWGLFCLLCGRFGVRFLFSDGGHARLRRERLLAARHIVRGVDGRFGLHNVCPVADGGELIGALGDVFGLGHRDLVVHGGEIEQDVREHPHKNARIGRAAARVLLRQIPEEERRQEIGAFAHLLGELPEKVRAGLAALGIELIHRVHMLLAEPGAALPETERAGHHKLIQLLCKTAPRDFIKRLRVGDIGFMQLLRGAFPGCRHGAVSFFCRPDGRKLRSHYTTIFLFVNGFLNLCRTLDIYI